VRLRLRAKRTRQRFADGYGIVAMHAASRVSANTLEWGAVFLPLLWVAAAATGGEDAWVTLVGWAYVASRALYAVLAVGAGGVSAQGPQPVIFVATLPAYLCLNYLAFAALKALLF
jgi:uncharacterized membrane protein YecN with MAPEG domain